MSNLGISVLRMDCRTYKASAKRWLKLQELGTYLAATAPSSSITMNGLRNISLLIVVVATIISSAVAAPGCGGTNNRRAIDVEDGSDVSGKDQAAEFRSEDRF